jgi:hypothetical protein
MTELVQQRPIKLVAKQPVASSKDKYFDPCYLTLCYYTSDDVGLLNPVESGQADFTIGGLKEGTQV